MEVDLVTDEASEDENYVFDDVSEDYLNFEGERCGICTDVVIDRGVLDCCQHWFCFACIDNWASITSLCPLCQNEFQLITCVPVYDTVGGNKTDDDTNPRDDDWFIEGKNNTLSFPSYYIDENAVVCLDGDGCKIRSGSVAIEEDSDIDTSIACDYCDKWYHAFCVGFDPDGTCDSSWLCPRCTSDRGSQKPERVSTLRESSQNSSEIANGDSPAEASFSGRVSVSVADDGETAVVISLVEGNHDSKQSSESELGCSNDVENTLLSSAMSNTSNSEVLSSSRNSLEPSSCRQEMILSLSEDKCYSLSHSTPPAELKISPDEAVARATSHLNKKIVGSGLNLDLGLSMGSDTSDGKVNDIAEDHVPGSAGPNNRSEEVLQVASAENVVPSEMDTLSVKREIPDEKGTVSGISGAKRKLRDSSGHRNVGDGEANVEAKFSRKKVKVERNSQPISLTGQTAVSVADDSGAISGRNSSRDSTIKVISEKENGASNIMDIVQGTERKSLKQMRHKNSSEMTSKERETATGLRVKKIMRRASDGKDSLVLVQELRKKIREAVRNKSSKELGQNLFDPKLLDAFRAAMAGSGAENRKPTLDVKAKKSLLQKGKVRESLTKKIYGTGGKRQRAWTRECEVEFWKHRCIKTSKPEKIQTLKSVLNVLRDDSDSTKTMPGNEEESKDSILSRVYLADASVFPRKNDIQPVSFLKPFASPEQKTEIGSTEKVSPPLPIDKSERDPQKQSSSQQVGVPPLDSKEVKKSVKGMKTETASGTAHQKRYTKGAPSPALGGVKRVSDKDKESKSDTIKGDKRKWALELLARKTAESGKNREEKEEDNLILKGNYTLLAQLPKDMRPVLAPSRHNKIPMAVRQAQLYRLTEHFLKKANLSVVCKTAETELAVADAVNIEKQVADRSNSKLVYVNLCSQELRRRSDDMNADGAKEEMNPCSTSDRAPKETHCSSLDLAVDEALKNAGLSSDSPPDTPNRPTEDIKDEVGSREKSDEEGPDDVIEVDSHAELDIYGDFEYNLEDDDFIGAGASNISNLQLEPPKIKLLFSSLKPEKPDGILDLPDHKVETDSETLAGSSGVLESQNKTSTGESTMDSGTDECPVQNYTVDNDEDLSLAECEELYGPDKEPLIQKYPDTVSLTPLEQPVSTELPGEDGDLRLNNVEKDSGQPSVEHMDGSKQSPSNSQKGEILIKKEETTKSETKQSEHNSTVVKKVEAYIKEHIRPLCKSGVITVDQYRWAVAKTTEKVMKYHAKEKNAKFLIKEGEKVKKLAEQYVEAAAQQKAKT